MPNDPIRNRAAEQVKVTIVIDTEAPPYKVHSFVQENLPLLILIWVHQKIDPVPEHSEGTEVSKTAVRELSVLA